MQRTSGVKMFLCQEKINLSLPKDLIANTKASKHQRAN
jgi:hypothetical protein